MQSRQPALFDVEAFVKAYVTAASANLAAQEKLTFVSSKHDLPSGTWWKDLVA